MAQKTWSEYPRLQTPKAPYATNPRVRSRRANVLFPRTPEAGPPTGNTAPRAAQKTRA